MNQPHTIHLSSWARLVVLSLLLGFGLLAGGLLSSNTAHAQPAATLTVTDCSGETGPGQIGTILSGAASGDTITFSCSGDIPLTSSLTINTNLTIDGSGQNVTLDGQGKVQVLIIKSTVTLKALTIVNGYGPSGTYGGGLDIFGTVNIINSTISNSHAFYGGGMEIEGSGTANITDSTISNNSANGRGGGIQSSGTFTLTNSTITNNTAAEAGGVDAATEGTSTISNSTISGNYAVACCAGGISTYMGTVTITGSIIAGNKAPQLPDCDLESTVNRSYNLESGTDCGFSGNGSKQGVDPLLSPLANNGGPTQTMALQQGSPASDVIPSARCPSTDQRGVSRPDNAESTCDIGAYEFVDPADKDLGLTNVPANSTVDAISPQGATVTYSAPTATDESGDTSSASVNCTPASGSTFAIGTTTVTCTVSDSDDTNSPVSASFTVTVNGASAQTSNLITTITSFNLPGNTSKSYISQLQTVQADLSANNTAQACSDLTGFINHVQAQSGKQLTVSQANKLITGARRVQAVLGC